MTSSKWLRRQRSGARAPFVVIDEVEGFMPPPPTMAAAAVAVAAAPETSADVAAELAALRERASKLQAELAVQTVRADDAEQALSNQNELLDHKDQVIAALRQDHAPVENRSSNAPAWWGGAETEPAAGTEAAHWYRIAHAHADQLEKLQAANEAHDRHQAASARWPQ